MTIENLKTLAIIALSSFVILGYVHTSNTNAVVEKDKNMSVTEEIKLYSNGKLIGQWEGIGQGQLEGDTYTFKTERGSFSNKMRISGDLVIETNPN